MKIDLVFMDHTRSKRPALSRAAALRIVRETLEVIPPYSTKTVELAVVLVGQTRIRTLNGTWRGKDEPTDVLAFPLSRPHYKGYTALSLGDVFICPTMVRKKASETGLPLRTQMAWTLVHGVLHLMGHDHERSSGAAKRMAALERRILGNLNMIG